MTDLAGLTSTHTERVAMLLFAICGLISGIATSGLLVYLMWSAYGWNRRGRNGFQSFLHTDAGKYLVSLIVVDLCHAIAYTSGLHWVRKGKLELGGACTFQAVFLQAGDLGTAVWVFVISAHTLVHLFFSRRPPSWLSTTTLCIGWFVILFVPIIGPTAIQRKDVPFYDPGSRILCWVSTKYPTPQLLYFFVWTMCALGASIICYTLVFLRTAGYLSGGRLAPAHESRGRSRSVSRWACVNAFGHESAEATDSGPSSGSGSGAASRQPKTQRHRSMAVGQSTQSIARKLLLYPVAYAILVVPLTISSLLSMAGDISPQWLLVLATCVYALGGFVDTLLFIFTRRSFIQNASSTSRSRSRHQTAATGNPPERHRLEGITVTRHELTIVDANDFEAHSELEGEDKGQFVIVEDGVTPVSPGKRDGPFDFADTVSRTPEHIMWTAIHEK